MRKQRFVEDARKQGKPLVKKEKKKWQGTK